MDAPRTLTFASVSEAVAEVDRLRERGYRSLGNWDLRQSCEHLADWLGFAIDGFPPQPLLARPAFWLIRNTLAPRMMRKTLAKGRMSAGLPTAPSTVHPPLEAGAGDERAAEEAAIERFQATVARFVAHQGEYAPSPMFGQATRDEVQQMHALHCALHLGFLEPIDSTEEADVT
ncbi:DUF1569 domain-containing protein [Alienimonas chondri]|uniref:DUF1569 domain-containing protein n=1 Tax=Alienimonas chondri TaxID=2681879 RepID=A0ABX1VAR4_9PLAN|nr:DUF1569 domain-containing protein [Alienimonas chondri]NNJ25016.1 hypothetical protein [Alienimonas chondri]